ncbi:MAG: T9SS type A sorting domain-containing protein, partial [Bacteroidia bacterium]
PQIIVPSNGVTAAQTYTYSLTIKNTYNCTTTKSRNVIVRPNLSSSTLSISSNPTSPSVCDGNSIVLTSSLQNASNYGTLTYQWFRDNATTAIATTANYTVSASATSTANYGLHTFKVKVSNGCSATTIPASTKEVSTTAEIKLAPIPTISPVGTNNIVNVCASNGVLTANTTGANLYSWQWKLGTTSTVANHSNAPNLASSPSNGSSYSYLQNNLFYSVIATYANGCTRQSSAKKVTINFNCRLANDSTDLNNNNLDENVEVFPNPTSGEISIQIKDEMTKSAKVLLMNSLGQVVLEKSFDFTGGNLSQQLDLSRFASGMYYLHFEAENFKVVKKVVKE